MSDRLKMPPVRDFGFYQRRKHDKWREVPTPEPALEAPVADSHAHIHMLPEPAWELTRCAANRVDYICMIVDPAEDGSRPFDELDAWVAQARRYLEGGARNADGADVANVADGVDGAKGADCSYGADGANDIDEADGVEMPASLEPVVSADLSGELHVPQLRIAVGVHPHNAKLYDAAVEAVLIERLADPRVGALGEIGLDYHYDLSPRDVQQRVFERQIGLAKQLGLPIALHLRGGEDPAVDDAHREAFEILEKVGFPEAGTLLHCCALPPDELRPWVEAGCYVAYGGVLTFKNAEAARAGALIVPEDRLMVETDSPYMTPEPMRGAACTPAHVVFTAACLAEVRGIEPGSDRALFLAQLHENTERFYAS